MNILVLTSCQPRHTFLLELLASLADTVYACIETTTLFPGQSEDFYHATDVMKSYFARVQAAELAEFGSPKFLPDNVRVLPMKSGDLNRLDKSSLEPALVADLVVVYGASYIRPPLIEALIELRALNIHMGTSPYYRGSSCNFWALYDERPDYVGATIHELGRGLDSGSILCHALPEIGGDEEIDGFLLGMRAVKTAFSVLVELIKDQRWQEIERVKQDKSLQYRYTRNRDFTDEIASEYLGRVASSDRIHQAIENRDLGRFISRS
jgi:hypothetical protein